MTPTDVRVPFFVPSRSCVCVSVGCAYFYPTSTPSPRRFSVCKLYLMLCAASAVRLAMGLLAAARAAARRRFVRGGREVAGEEPEVP